MSDKSYVSTGDSPLIDAIRDGVVTKEFKIDGRTYTDRPLYLPEREELVAGLVASTLSSVVDFLNNGIDTNATMLKPYVVVVRSPNCVEVVSQAGDEEDRRRVALKSTASLPELKVLGGWVEGADAVINIQSGFIDTEERARLLAIVGNLAHQEELKQEDDGVSQTVTVKRGFKKLEQTVGNPFILNPYRTFPEISQPSSPFILRLDKDADGISIKLVLADGGAWFADGVRSVKEWLDGKIDQSLGVTVIA